MRYVLVAALLMLPAPLLASTPAETASAETVAAPAPAKKEKKVCKVVDNGSTSRMQQRVCRTVKEWAEDGKKGATTADLERISR